ncbi:MAG: hypothetical protein ABEJ30_02335 [Halorientalis sp.]
MTDHDISRRRVLQGGTVASAMALAGCSSVTNLLGGGGGGAYTQWLYAPGTISNDDHYQFQLLRPQKFEAHEDNLGSFYENIQGQSEIAAVELDFAQMKTLVSADPGAAITHQKSADDITGSLEDNGFDQDDEHEGYDIYVGSDEQQAFGVSGSKLVGATPGIFNDVDPVNVVEAVIDAKVGKGERYVDENDDFDTLTDQIGGSTAYAFGGTHEQYDSGAPKDGKFEGSVATSLGISFDHDGATIKTYIVFEEQGAIDKETIRDVVEDDQYYEDVDGSSVSFSGRVAILTGRASYETLNES